MTPGDVFTAYVPSSTGGLKPRPALVLACLPGRHQDLLVCAISTQLHQETPGWDDILDAVQPDFASSGLRSRL